MSTRQVWLGEWTANVGATLPSERFAYRVSAVAPTSGCPRCGGKIIQDVERNCIACGWAGETRWVKSSPVARMSRTVNHNAATLELMGRVAEMRAMGIDHPVIAKTLGVSLDRSKRLATLYRREVLGEQ